MELAITDYAEQRFFKDTKEHRLDVLHEDGLYRHLRFKQPETIVFHFDIVTWPGHLAVTGDAGDFVFARTKDMVDFFMDNQGQQLRISPHYWSEKLVAPRPDGALEFSQRLYKQRVEEWLDEQVRDKEKWGEIYIPTLREVVEHDLLLDLPMDEHEARQRLDSFEQRIDSWEWDLRDYRFDFLWCCWAIVWGLRKYKERAGV